MSSHLPRVHDQSSHLRALCRSDNGVVFACGDCGAIQVRFGNVVLGLSHGDLDLLARTLTDLSHTAQGSSLPPIYLTDNGFGVHFTRDEARELTDLLYSARALRTHGVMAGLSDQSCTSEFHAH